MVPTFHTREFAARTERLQAAMAKRGLGAVLLMAEHDIRYITGYLTRLWESPTRPWFLVVPEFGQPIAVIPTLGAPLMSRTWIHDIRIWPSPRPGDDGVSLLCETLAEVCGPDAAIGVPMGPETALRMPLTDFDRIRDTLAPCQFVDISAELQAIQMIKSPAELALIEEMRDDRRPRLRPGGHLCARGCAAERGLSQFPDRAAQ